MYQGYTAEIVVGRDGLVGTKSVSTLKPSDLIIAENITYEMGTLQKAPGATKYNATPISGTPAVLAGFDYFPDGATQRMVIYTSAGDILKDDGSGAFATTLESGLLSGVDVTPQFFEGGKEAAANEKKLFFANGSDAPEYADGDAATLTAFTGYPADWGTTTPQPNCGALHEGRAWFASLHTLYFSTQADHSDLTGGDSGIFTVFPGEAQEIRAIASYKGLLLIWKFPFGVYFLDSTDPDITNWRIHKVSDIAGIAGPNGWAFVDNDVAWLDSTGNVQLLSSVLQFGKVEPRSLSQESFMRPFIEDTFNLARLRQVQAIYYAAKRQLQFAWTKSNSTSNDIILVVDMLRLDKARFAISDVTGVTALWIRLDANHIGRPVAGDVGGQVWLLDRPSRSRAGAAYNGRFQTPHLDFSWIDPNLATKQKLGQFLEVVTEPSGSWNIYVDVYWDGEFSETLTFTLGAQGSALDAFTLDVNALAGDTISHRKKRMVGSGRRLSLVVYNNQADQNFSVARMYLYFNVGDERILST